MDALGREDRARGIRSFVVGTGGKSLYRFMSIHKTSVVRNNSAYGVLKLTLWPRSYDWEFVAVPGARFRDKGSSPCH
jgi:hypothetical protein